MSDNDDAREVRRLQAALTRFIDELKQSQGRGISRSRVWRRLESIRDCRSYFNVDGMLCNPDGSRSIFDDVDA